MCACMRVCLVNSRGLLRLRPASSWTGASNGEHPCPTPPSLVPILPLLRHLLCLHHLPPIFSFSPLIICFIFLSIFSVLSLSPSLSPPSHSILCLSLLSLWSVAGFKTKHLAQTEGVWSKAKADHSHPSATRVHERVNVPMYP